MPSASDIFVSPPRVFVRSLHVLLKLTHLYGSHHVQSAAQLEEAWNDLKAAFAASGSPGLTLGAWKSDLIVNGQPVEAGAAESSLAQSMDEAGIVSIHFDRELKKPVFARFVRVFAGNGQRPGDLLSRLQSAFGEKSNSGIRINEVRYIAADFKVAGANPNATVPPQPSPHSNGDAPAGLDPEKLIQAISAAEASGKNRSSGFEFGEELLGATSRNTNRNGSSHALSEKEMANLLRLVAKLSESVRSAGAEFNSARWEDCFAAIPAAAQSILRESLIDLAAKWPVKSLDGPAMLRLAEEAVFRYVTVRLRHADIRPSAVRPLLETLSHDVQPLRHALRVGDAKTDKTDQRSESYAEVLHSLFWSSASEEIKKSILISPEAWCVPPRNIQPYVKELLRIGDSSAVDKILGYYVGCVTNHDAEIRRNTAAGLNQMAELYTREAGDCLDNAVRVIGEQLSVERDAEVQSLLSAAFVRFSHEAASKNSLPAVRQTLDTLASLERSLPSWTRGLRPRIGIINRIPEFIEQGLNVPVLRPELAEVLRRIPQAAADHLAARLMRVTRCAERERLVEMGCALGPRGSMHLQRALEKSPAPDGIRVAGLLSRIDPEAAEKLFPERIRSSGREIHDEALRQLSVAAAPERGRMLLNVLGDLDSMILPMALDEIGMCGDASLAPQLLSLAEGDLLPKCGTFLRVKALDSVGRLRNPSSAGQLRNFVESRRAFRWAYPPEMRIAAAQALQKIDPDQAQEVLPVSDLDPAMLAHAPLDPRPERDFVRYRRYPRVRMSRPVPAVIQSRRGKCEPAVQVLSLEGGLLTGDLQLAVGTPADLKIPSGLRPIRMEVLVRFSRANQAGVEMVSMDVEDRSRLRSLLVSMEAPAPQPNPILSMPS
ncbi:MAG TPA: PilZ domain-containing protein [Candidatus Acidoferrales bacterium]|nr:PilZ domain-containing protein [Candidatus Acidoferrales bacterium]